MSRGRFGIHGGQYIPETLMTQSLSWKKPMITIKMTVTLTGNLQIC